MRFTYFSAFFLGLALFSTPSLFAFQNNNTYQAQITGGGGRGKCTIEVIVDVVADVEVRGTTARLITQGGQPAQWRRFACNQAMPVNPGNFHFTGVDGRGRQTLVQDPSRSGVAVIRIEDPKGGSEGYTFDLEWDGGVNGNYGQPTGGSLNGGYNNGNGGYNSNDVAVRDCASAAQSQMRSNGYNDARVTDARFDDEPGNTRDWVSGAITGRRNNGNPETFQFSCGVDGQGRLRGNVNLRPTGGNNYNNGYNNGQQQRNNRNWDPNQARQACTDAVNQRLQGDGYQNIRLNNDANTSNADQITGTVMARRDGFRDSFQYSCAVDYRDARIRSVNVDRR